VIFDLMHPEVEAHDPPEMPGAVVEASVAHVWTVRDGKAIL
jgi:hypothetical protein